MLVLYRLLMYVASSGEGCDLISRFNPHQARTWISNVISCRGLVFMFNELKWEVIVRFIDIGGIVNQYSF